MPPLGIAARVEADPLIMAFPLFILRDDFCPPKLEPGETPLTL
jgi:hypothetical protein